MKRCHPEYFDTIEPWEVTDNFNPSDEEKLLELQNAKDLNSGLPKTPHSSPKIPKKICCFKTKCKHEDAYKEDEKTASERLRAANAIWVSDNYEMFENDSSSE
jgi:hypothetical protein